MSNIITIGLHDPVNPLVIAGRQILQPQMAVQDRGYTKCSGEMENNSWDPYVGC